MKTLVLGLVILLSLETAQAQSTPEKLSDAALELTTHQVEYDPSYFSIAYPLGDVPANKGVCTDVIIRAYRKLGKDLQQEVHEDMKAHFDLYPKNWGLARTDTNIDHRRVPNLMQFLLRKGTSKPITQNSLDYLPAISSAGTWVARSHTLALWWTENLRMASAASSSTTLAQVRCWRIAFSNIRLSATTDISGCR